MQHLRICCILNDGVWNECSATETRVLHWCLWTALPECYQFNTSHFGTTGTMCATEGSPPQHSACSESVGGPSGAARWRQQQFRHAHDDCRKSLHHSRRCAGGRSDRSATSRRPQNAAQRHVSPSATHRSAFRTVSRILVTTSGELILLPVRDRHPKLNVGRRPLTRYSDFDILAAVCGVLRRPVVFRQTHVTAVA